MKYIRLFGLLGLLIVLMAVTVDCSSTAKPLETEPDFTGFITEVHPIGEEGTLGQILVEAPADKLVVDPAYLVDYYHDGLGNFSHDYIIQFQN